MPGRLFFPAGGELLDQLEVEVRLKDDVARFYAACVIAALDSLHQKGYVYRVRVALFRPAAPFHSFYLFHRLHGITGSGLLGC